MEGAAQELTEQSKRIAEAKTIAEKGTYARSKYVQMEQKLAQLEQTNKELQEQIKAGDETGLTEQQRATRAGKRTLKGLPDLQLAKTVEARLDARIDACNRITEERVRAAVEKFESYVEARIAAEKKMWKPQPKETKEQGTQSEDKNT